MKLPRFVVYCGQDIDRERDVPAHIPGYAWCVFPESIGGANWVRTRIDSEIGWGDNVVIVTRYEHAVGCLANAVADGKLSRDDVVFNLVQVQDDGTVVKSVHKMSEDCQTIGDGWPIGVLW